MKLSPALSSAGLFCYRVFMVPLRHIFLKLALFAFVVRSLIPIGFMPGHSANHLYPLVICSGSGPVTINVPADKLPYTPQPAQQHGHDMPCPYAQAFAQGTLVDHPALLPVVAVSESVVADPETPFSLKAVSKGYFSNGPPAFPA